MRGAGKKVMADFPRAEDETIDAVRNAFQALIDGKLLCSVACSPEVGPPLMETIQAITAGWAVPRFIAVQDGVFTRENAGAVLPDRKY